MTATETSTEIATQPFTANGRTYSPPPRPLAVICVDGCDDAYLQAAFARDAMPHLAAICRTGFRTLADGALPSFTNVNNTSIVTGVPPSFHGISGNYFYDADAGKEVMMNSGRFLRAPTILSAAAAAGRKVGVVTAKEKLLAILNHQLKGIAFSSEKADLAKMETHGIDNVEALVGHRVPAIYSAEASLYVFWGGIALMERGLADFLYLSTTDYMQHTFAPDAPESIDFYSRLDRELGRLQALGIIFGLTADHGMNAKHGADGQPNVIYLETALDEKFGPGFRVILPITDPYVAHHGALGSFAVIYLPPEQAVGPVCDWLRAQPGITEVYDQDSAAQELELPANRLGDIVAMSSREVVLGRRPADHDLSALHGALRSHGGRFEQRVPFIVSHPLNAAYQAKADRGGLRNFDIFDFAINGASL